MSQSRFLEQSVAHQLSLSNLYTICKGRTHRSLWSGFPTTCPCPSVPCLPLARSRRQRAWGTLLQFKSCSSVHSLRHVSCLVACFRLLLILPLVRRDVQASCLSSLVHWRGYGLYGVLGGREQHERSHVSVFIYVR